MGVSGGSQRPRAPRSARGAERSSPATCRPARTARRTYARWRYAGRVTGRWCASPLPGRSIACRGGELGHGGELRLSCDPIPIRRRLRRRQAQSSSVAGPGGGHARDSALITLTGARRRHGSSGTRHDGGMAGTGNSAGIGSKRHVQRVEGRYPYRHTPEHSLGQRARGWLMVGRRCDPRRDP